MRTAASRAKAFYARMGFTGPLWVTETGYPSDPAYQWDPALRGGPTDQARWIARGPRYLIDDGADAVFVAFRDNPEFSPREPMGVRGARHVARARSRRAGYAPSRRSRPCNGWR